MDEELPLLGRADELRAFQHVSSAFGAPAYIRRGRRVQEALDALLRRCQRQRDEWLRLTRVRLGLVRALAGEWEVLRPWLRDNETLASLRRLHEEWQPRPPVDIAPTTSPRRLRAALRELAESISFFNERWRRYVMQVDLSEVNTAREQYNRYYVLEKECAVRSPRVARQGFQPLPPLTHAELLEMVPLVPEVALETG
ncbi:MAG: hypothetical protein ACK4RK_00610 [Gemmataceae bacterium]